MSNKNIGPVLGNYDGVLEKKKNLNYTFSSIT